jgi:hypothetical protein
MQENQEFRTKRFSFVPNQSNLLRWTLTETNSDAKLCLARSDNLFEGASNSCQSYRPGHGIDLAAQSLRGVSPSFEQNSCLI